MGKPSPKGPPIVKEIEGMKCEKCIRHETHKEHTYVNTWNKKSGGSLKGSLIS